MGLKSNRESYLIAALPKRLASRKRMQKLLRVGYMKIPKVKTSFDFFSPVPFDLDEVTALMGIDPTRLSIINPPRVNLCRWSYVEVKHDWSFGEILKPFLWKLVEKQDFIQAITQKMNVQPVLSSVITIGMQPYQRIEMTFDVELVRLLHQLEIKQNITLYVEDWGEDGVFYEDNNPTTGHD
jgi:Domain of unknown function (DUF4279)